MEPALTDKVIREQLGNPADVAKELQAFQRSAKALSSDRPRMIDQYPNQWIAVQEGRVKANAKTFETLMAEVEKKKLPRRNLIIRFIDTSERTMIL
jgi:hypothetical protein